MRVRSTLGRVVTGLLGLQLFLGLVDVVLLAPTWMQILHLLGADLYWIALVALAAELIWPERNRMQATALTEKRRPSLPRAYMISTCYQS